MSVSVYNGEKFQRNNLWYVIFAVIFASVFVLSLLNNNVAWAILIFFLLGGYFYYSSINNQIITITLDRIHISIGAKNYPRNSFVWYAVEIHPKTQEIQNVVFITTKGHMIYTFEDSLEHIRSFLLDLDWYLPMLGEYNQTSLEKFSRKMKL